MDTIEQGFSIKTRKPLKSWIVRDSKGRKLHSSNSHAGAVAWLKKKYKKR